MRVRAVNLLANEALPEELRQYDRVLDAKALGRVLHSVAVDYPDRYAEVVKNLGDIGRHAAYYQGETMGLDDLENVVDTKAALQAMGNELKSALKGVNDPDEKRKIREEVWGKWAARLERETMEQGAAKGNAVIDSVRSGARGKPLQARAMLATPALFEDSKGRMVPIFARSSYGEGISPAEFLAGTYGARASVTSTKTNTARGGAWSKMLAQVAAPVVVTMDDCGTQNGIDLPAEDRSMRGRVLARSAAGIEPGAVVGRKEWATLKNKAKGAVLVRSPLTCEATSGVCAKCAGALPEGKLPDIGYAVGLTSSTATGEPVTQGSLSFKHLSGAAQARKEYSGLDWLERFVQIPDNFPDRAPVAKTSGTVSIQQAPQGGHYVHVGDQQHYVPQHLELKVQNGQDVEEGDVLSAGIVRPDDIVRHRGVGEGRRYYAERLHQMLAEGGTPASMRNLEAIARAAVNHVQIDDPEDLDDNTVPDDIVPYQRLASKYMPPVSAAPQKPALAVGQYLQKPALHYTIGTKLTPSMTKRLEGAGFKEVFASKDAPSFRPEMLRLQTQAFANDDWLASMHTSYLRKQLAAGVTRGQDTNVKHNVHFAPRLAVGEGFAANIKQTGQF